MDKLFIPEGLFVELPGHNIRIVRPRSRGRTIIGDRRRLAIRNVDVTLHRISLFTDSRGIEGHDLVGQCWRHEDGVDNVNDAVVRNKIGPQHIRTLDGGPFITGQHC